MAMKITRLPQTIRNFSRLYVILRVLSKHGFGDVVARIGLEGTWERVKRRATFGRWGRAEIRHYRTEERIRMAFEELGSTFIKFGQILATRPDLVPMSLIHELRKLQDNVPPFDPAVAKRTVEEEIRAKVEDVFAEFDEKPLAAASIAQVHRARLKNGDEVVVKVQRPGLRGLIDADLDLLHVLAEVLEEQLPEMKQWMPVKIIEEFDKSIHKEIDFGREAHNIRKFAKNFAGDPAVYVPRVYDDLSTSRILTMEFIHGIKMNSDEIFKRKDLDRELIAKNGIRFTLTQTFVHGFFHADPHPGNIFIMPGNVICLIDFGMMGRLDQERIDDLLGFLVSVLTQNPERMIRQFQKQGLVDETVDTRAMQSEISDLMDRYLGMEIMKIDVAIYIQQLFEIITRYKIVMPADLLLMGKSLATIDGIARDIYPELDPLSAIRPYILQIYFRRLADPEFYTRDTLRAVEEGIYFLQKLPKDLRIITAKLREGEFKVRMVPDGASWDRYIREHNRSANRLAAAVLIVGLLGVSSYLVAHAREAAYAALAGAEAGVPTATAIALPAVGGGVLEWLGIAGFLAAGMFGVGFLYGLLRSGGQ
jgi:ubiquinone biosynthesis protein